MTPKDPVPRTDSSSNGGEEATMTSVKEDATGAQPSSSSSSSCLPPTDMLYMTYEGNWWTECQASVLQVQTDAEKKVYVTLDRTVMHAQGGGQPTDKGVLVKQQDTTTAAAAAAVACLQVEKVTMDRTTGIATHAGTWKVPDQCFEVGDSVHVQVDKDTRQILSECHTAGHVVDSAMAKCGKFLKPAKAYHFLEGPYVEYEGTLDAQEKTTLLEKLQQAFHELVQQDIPTEIALLSVQDADELCNRQAQNFDMNMFQDTRTREIRVVTVAGFPCPCGGTHVRSTGELRQRQWGITKLQSKKGIVRVKYGQNTKK